MRTGPIEYHLWVRRCLPFLFSLWLTLYMIIKSALDSSLSREGTQSIPFITSFYIILHPGEFIIR